MKHFIYSKILTFATLGCAWGGILWAPLDALALKAPPSETLLFRYPIKEVTGPGKLGPVDVPIGIGVSALLPSEALVPAHVLVAQPTAMPISKDKSKYPKQKGDYWVKGWPQEDQPDPNRYIEFRFSPQCGYEVSFEYMAFTLYSSIDETDSIVGPRYWEVHVAVDEPTTASSFSRSFIGKLGKGISSWLGAEGEKKVVVYRHDMGAYGNAYVNVAAVPLRNIRLLETVRPGATLVFRFYGYGARGGKGGFYHLGQAGSDVALYGSIKPMEACYLVDTPVLPKKVNAETVAYLVDGTWGHEAGGRDFESASIVAKLRHIYKGRDAGKAIYFRGTGNEKDYPASVDQLTRGAVGAGAMALAEAVYHQVVENYNNGYTGMIFVGWSRGAAVVAQVVSFIYHRGIPNAGRKGGYYVQPTSDCLTIDQVHLLDMVHSMVVPGNDVNHGWYDRVLPPNIQRAWHYLADTDNPPTGFKQTRPLSAVELPMCRNIGIIPSHGDVGGKSGSLCSKIVLKTVIENMNSLGAIYIVNATMPVQLINPQPVPVQIYSTQGILVDEEVI